MPPQPRILSASPKCVYPWFVTDPVTGAKKRGTYGYYQSDDIGTKGSTGGTIDNIYIQDRWRPIRRLSLDLGVRFEKEVVPSFRRDIKEYAFEFGWNQKIAPRLAASFDVLGNGRMKVFGSWGLVYNWIPYELSRGSFGGDYWRVRYRALDTLNVLSLSGTNLPGRNIWPYGDFRDRRVPNFDSVDPNRKERFPPDWNDLVRLHKIVRRLLVE